MAKEDMMTIANVISSFPALAASLPGQPSSNQTLDTDSVSDLFDPPVAARDDMKFYRQARRARQEWRKQRYTRLVKG